MKNQLVAIVVPLLVHSAFAAPSISALGSEISVQNDISITDALQRVWKGVSCLGACRSSWGWTGSHFGADPWGGVLKVGDPLPYSDSNNQANTPSSSSSSADETSSTSDPGLAIQDFTLSAETEGQQSTVSFSVYYVSTVISTTSSSIPNTPTIPAEPTTTSSQDPPPSPDPQPSTTEQQQDPAPTSSSQDPPPSPSPSPTPDTSNQNQGNTSSDDQAQYLAQHNAARAQHGANPVTWSDELEGFAQEWANNCQFQHSGGKFGRVGENLAAGTGAFSIADAVGAWVAEAPEYDPNNPVASHFTQVVWKSTTQIGCAKATCSGIFSSGVATFYVCEYSPAGNVIGQFAANVQV